MMNVPGVQAASEAVRLRGFPIWKAALFLCAAGSLAYYLPFIPPELREAGYLGAEVAAIAAVFAAVFIVRPSRRVAWLCIVVGMVLWTAGDAIWDWLKFVENASPSPSAADAFYLVEYPALIAGVTLIVRGRPDRATFVDAAILTIGMGVLLWELTVQPYLRDSSLSTTELLVDVAYPFADMVMIAVVARLALSVGLATPAMRLLAAGLVLTLVTDIGYLLISVMDLPWDPMPTDFAAPAAMFLWVAAIWHPSSRVDHTVSSQDWLTRRALRLGLLGLAALLIPAAIAIDALAGNYASLPTTLGAWIVLVVLIVVRIEDILAQTMRLEGQLRQAQKMEAIGQLAGGVAHDFNNLLTAISGYAELLQSGLDRSDPKYGDAAEILKASDRAAALTRQLLAFGRRQMLQPQVLDLNEAVHATTTMTERLIGAHVQLNLRLSPEAGLVRVDPGQLAQVLMNLTLNARDAMPDGGCLTIETGRAIVTGRQSKEFGGLRPGVLAVLTVRDTGVGMDSETAGHLFEPFFTTKPVGKGTGLGLATVYGIIRQSEGAIVVESKPGAGSTFRVYLPQIQAPGQDARPFALSTGTLDGGETILVVEDEQSVLRLASSILGRRGYHVLEAGSPEEAEEIVAGLPGRIDLLITDVIMPGRNGADLAERIGARRPDIKVLFMSGYTEDVIDHHGVLDAGRAFIQKPFSHEGFLIKVREVIDTPPAARRG
jgi:signal transduction histidine kinase/CheY-like chemotaxis protein